MRTIRFIAVAAFAAFLASSSPAGAAISGITRVATSLSSPMFVTHAPGDRSRLFIGLRGGTIRVLNLTTGLLETNPFLSIPSVDQEGEGGLLGMTFHPDYATNGNFYVNVTIDNGGQVFQGATSPFSTEIRQYTVSGDPNIASTTATTILKYIQPQSNHNAGWIGFSPANGYLYIPTGDGGAGHTADTGNAQDNTDNLLGKILRIDVNGDDFPGDANRNYKIIDSNPYADVRDAMRNVTSVVTGDDEIWALGMRNPFRDSFDRQTGDLWLGDVGQSSKEEIDRQPTSAVPGENFGWRQYEGKVTNPTLPNYRDPVYDYGRTGAFGGKTVIGGYVYRGPDPDLQDKYFFADTGDFGNAASNKFWNFSISNPTGTVADIKPLLTPDVGSPGFPSAFGEDAVGNLYIVYLETGDVYRIATNKLLAGDYDADGDVDDADSEKWRSTFGTAAGSRPADGNGNGVVDAADYVVWRKNLGATVHAGAGAASGAAVPELTTAVYLLELAAALCSVQLFDRRRRRWINDQ